MTLYETGEGIGHAWADSIIGKATEEHILTVQRRICFLCYNVILLSQFTWVEAKLGDIKKQLNSSHYPETDPHWDDTSEWHWWRNNGGLGGWIPMDS